MKSSPVYPLATTTWDEREYAALQSVIQSGRFTNGPLVRQFENEFAAYFGSSFAVMVNSGSSANLIAVSAAVLDPRFDLKRGDEVLVPAVSWPTTYYPLTQYGLRPVFVDIDVDTLNVNLDLLEESVSPRTRAIMAVNLLGNPNDLSRLRRLAATRDLLLLEDNCESLGAEFDGIAAGTAGLAGTFSTFFSHHIATMEGGLVLTDDEQLYQEMISMRSHGWTRELPPHNHVYDKSGNDWDDLFRFVLPGYNVRPLEMEGAIGLQQLRKVPDLLRGRRANAEHFVDRFSQIPEVRVQRETGHSSWFGFSLVLEGALSGRRAELVEAFTTAGIESRPIVAGNFTRNPVMAHLDAIVPEALPAADKIHVDGLFLGNHHYPIHEQLELAAKTVESVAARRIEG